ncbi:hypothetical protein AVEN_114358-1 [Araneus ventricosus]|uniref:Uncharacterized protein n=1 Tax=Araneus ventricosus TaxID=182803 RepID=A0A4Y2M4Z9_ARAVE|nr:hypothetical protein AVEN_114358-1 [Araneus ventricosus]
MVFTFAREPHSPPHARISAFMAQHSKWISTDVGFPNFSTTTIQFSSDYRIDGQFWSDETKCAWSGVIVNECPASEGELISRKY